MRRYLMDTGTANDWINRTGGTRDRAILAARDGHVLGICTPVLAERWAGVENSASRDINVPRLRHAVAQLTVWPLTDEAAQEYGRLYAVLRRAGRTIGSNDLLIVACALTVPRCIVVTRDADFSAVPGLRTENWYEPVGRRVGSGGGGAEAGLRGPAGRDARPGRAGRLGDGGEHRPEPGRGGHAELKNGRRRQWGQYSE